MMPMRGRRYAVNLIGTLVLLFSSTSFAPVYAGAKNWSVDMANSRLGFIATQAGAEFKGQFQKFRAEITFSPDDLVHSFVDVEINMLSVDTQSYDRDTTIITSDWFHTSMFPIAQFRADRFVALGEGRYEAHAQLTMRKISREVVLLFELTIEENPNKVGMKRAIVSGRLDLLRTAWGVGQGQWADTSTVGDKVVVVVELTAEQAD
jgi:polyisoprenoid-binding protein YceI